MMSGRPRRNGPDAAPQNTLDRTFETLRSARRRRILDELAERGTGLGLSVLAELLAGVTSDDDPERIAVRLHHVDLPKLVDADLIEYDRDARTATLTDDGSAAVALTRGVAENQ